MQRVSITLTTRDRPGFAFVCLSSLLSQSFKKWDLLIVDASEIPLTEYVEFRLLMLIMENMGHKVDVVFDRNVGITQAWQLGMERSASELGQRLEDDIWLEPNYLKKLYQVIIGDDRIAAVAGSNPNPFFPDTTELVNRVVEEQLSLDRPFFPNILFPQDNSLIPTDGQATTLDLGQTYKVCHLHGLFMYRKAAVQSVGGFATHTSRFGHRDETDLTLRLFFGGYDIVVCPDARLWHAEAPYGGARDDREERIRLATRDEETFQERLKAWMEQNKHMLEEVTINNFGILGDLHSIIRRRD